MRALHCRVSGNFGVDEVESDSLQMERVLFIMGSLSAPPYSMSV